jgi:hypothetical protein
MRDESQRLGSEVSRIDGELEKLRRTPSAQTSYRTVASDTTSQVSDGVILVDSTGGNRTVTLMPPGDWVKPVLYVKKLVAANNMVVDAGGLTIDGAASVTTATQWFCYAIGTDGSNFYLLS